MLPVELTYPVFEANQVLSNEHLNQLFAYLDEQERLTRTNLIGIGIVCGLEPRVNGSGNAIRISKGCGTTSEGYLIVWEDPGELEWYRPYTVPERIAYREFEDRSTLPVRPFPLWELMTDRNDDETAVRLSNDFLTGNNRPTGEEDEKILLLFLECEATSNRNCTPNSCDDKGSTVTATVRPLLARRRDIDRLQARVRALGPATEAYFSLADTFGTRLGLPELRLPRFDVESTALSSSATVFNAFQRTMQKAWIDRLADALSAAYAAFRPLLRDYTSDPFATLRANWAFMHDGGIVSQKLYIWYQYFYDHLATVLQAYDEFRERGLSVLGLCCPDSRLFPRHLLLANVGTRPPGNDYRHTFVPSPLFAQLQGAMVELQQLFRRLVELVRGLELPPQVAVFGFSNTLVALRRATAVTEIRITPSALALPLSYKAIPYHYVPDPLFRTWSYRLSRQGKDALNLGYRAGSWNTNDDFVRRPLRYDLEPHNFLRIEGHIGQDYRTVLSELLAQKNRYRLPIEIVALKTGRHADDIELPDDLAGCHFQDLEAVYSSLREELRCQLCHTLTHFYNTPVLPAESRGRTFAFPRLAFLRACSPTYRYVSGTVGELYENNFDDHSDTFPSYDNVPLPYRYHIFFIFWMSRVADTVPARLADLSLTDFNAAYGMLERWARLRNEALLRQLNDAEDGSVSLPPGLDYEEHSDQLDQLLHACKSEAIRGLWAEYERRREQLREALLLAFFARKHPGLQHKAGVPLGGTFIIVYHGEDQRGDTTIRRGRFVILGRVVNEGEPLVGVNLIVEGTTAGTTTDVNGNFNIVVSQLPARLRISALGIRERSILITGDRKFHTLDLARLPTDTDTSTDFNELETGIVIADFYLPYLCCSDCQPIQFVLPKAPPTFAWEQVGCTSPNGTAAVRLTATGGTPPYQYSPDEGKSWHELGDDPVDLNDNGSVRVRDAEGTESVSQTVRLRDPLVLDPGAIECSEDGRSFTVQIFIGGGQPPYTLSYGDETVTVPANQRGQATFPSGQGGEVVVRDSSEPACEARVQIDEHECESPCTLPCNGLTLNCGHPFFLQRPTNNDLPYLAVTLKVEAFAVTGDTPERRVTFTDDQLTKLTSILNPDRNLVSASAFTQYWNRAIAEANTFIQEQMEAVFTPDDGIILTLEYDPTGVNNFTTLRVTRYACFDYNFVLSIEHRDRFERFYQYRWSYSSKGATLELVVRDGDNVSEMRSSLPPYNCIELDRCDPNAEERARCQDPRAVGIIEAREGRQFLRRSLRIEPEFNELPKLWYVEGGMPPAGTASKLSVQFPRDNTTYEVRVIVVDRTTTCASVATHRVEIPAQIN